MRGNDENRLLSVSEISLCHILSTKADTLSAKYLPCQIKNTKVLCGVSEVIL